MIQHENNIQEYLTDIQEYSTWNNSSGPDRKHKGEYWGSEMVFPGNNGPQYTCRVNCELDPQGMLLMKVFKMTAFGGKVLISSWIIYCS